MAKVEANPLLPTIAGMVVLVAAAGAYIVSTDDDQPAVVVGQGEVSVNGPTEADADSTNDTITALSGMVDTLNQSVSDVTERNDQLAVEKEQLQQEANEKIDAIQTRISDQMQQLGESNQSVVSALTDQMDAMKEQLGSVEEKLAAAREAATRPAAQTDASGTGFTSLSDMLNGGGGGDSGLEVVPGIGLDSLGSGGVSSGTEIVDFVWIDPLDRESPEAMSPQNAPALNGLADGSLLSAGLPSSLTGRTQSAAGVDTSTRSSSRQVATNAPTEGSGNNASNTPEAAAALPAADDGRRFTLPDLSILSDAVSLTALVGRIYTDDDDDITDPWPFKIMIGQENLTANFNDLPPDIDGMLFEGYGVGDWTLSCVRGWVTVASFVFDDGTVLPAYADSPGSRDSKYRLNTDAIGYLSDPYGNPCVLGEKVSNAAGYLAARTAAAAATGYAEALNADNEVTSNSIGTDGTVSSVTQVLNSSGTFAAREAYAAAFSEGADYITERQAQEFDAVYVPSGTEVVVNLQSELQLDKRADARQLVYSGVREQHSNGLD